MGIGEEAEQGEAAGPPGTGRKRERSLIEFPYSDLKRAVELAEKLAREAGSSQIDQTALAVAMDQSVAGGTFRGRLSAAKLFGFIETRQSQVWLTPLGLAVVDPATARAAKVTAFLNVPLYRELFSRFNGHQLPPAAAIERQMATLGVPPKQVERARQAFSVSANVAGYISANGRFSKPLITGDVGQQVALKEETAAENCAEREPEARNVESVGNGNGGGGNGLPPLHPAIIGLLRELPPAKSDWSVQDRADWLDAAATMFKVIYKGSGTIKVSATPPITMTAADQ